MKNKPFDCVEMKNQIQEQLRKEYEGLSPEEIRRRRQQELETSDDPVFQKWRRLKPSPFAE